MSRVGWSRAPSQAARCLPASVEGVLHLLTQQREPFAFGRVEVLTGCGGAQPGELVRARAFSLMLMSAWT